MLFRVARDAETERIAGTNERDQFGGIRKTVRMRLEIRRVAWLVAAHRQDVLDAEITVRVENGAHLRWRQAVSREVGQDLMALLLLQPLHELARAVARRAARAESNREEV